MAASNVAPLVTSVVLGVALLAETLGRDAIGLAPSVPGHLLMVACILAPARGGVAPSVVPCVATAIEGALYGAHRGRRCDGDGRQGDRGRCVGKAHVINQTEDVALIVDPPLVILASLPSDHPVEKSGQITARPVPEGVMGRPVRSRSTRTVTPSRDGRATP